MRYIHPRRWTRVILRSARDFFVYYVVPDKLYLKAKYRQVHGVKLNLYDPKTIDEKIQWIKLYDRKPFYHNMIDKIASKDYIEKILGTNEYTVPLLGQWKHFDEIDFSTLPMQFVLKCNHDSGSWIICKNKNTFDKVSARRKLEKALRTNYYKASNKQWGYDKIERKILAEKYLDKDKIEYQVFCNNARPVFFLVRNDIGESLDGYNVCYSLDWIKKDYRNKKFPNIEVPKPNNLKKMLEISKALSKDTLHLRVDFYEMEGKIYVGELTFYSNGGDFCNFSNEGKKVLTETLQLPIKHTE